jgi:hypothetical protein
MNYYDKMLSFFEQDFIDNEVKKMNINAYTPESLSDTEKKVINLTFEQGLRAGLLLCLHAWTEELEKAVKHDTVVDIDDDGPTY